MNTFTDHYLTGAPAVIADIAAINAAADQIGPATLDGVSHLCVRLPEGEPLGLPSGVTRASVSNYPETARVVLGGFMADPAPLPDPAPEEWEGEG
jgi:hypothetical protein